MSGTYYLAPSAGLAYLQIPKVACSTLKLGMLRIEDPEKYADHREWADKIHSAVFDPDNVVQVGTRDLSDYLRFTFVRNPYSRFVSFYRDKILKPGFLKLAPGKDVSYFDWLYAPYGFQHGMSIEAAARVLMTCDPDTVDPHLMPQTHYLMHGDELTVDYIGRLERFDRDAGLIEGVAGRADLFNTNLNRIAMSPYEWVAHCNQEAGALISAYYQEDFAFLGYSTEIREV